MLGTVTAAATSLGMMDPYRSRPLGRCCVVEIGKFRKGLKDDIAFVHAGRPQSGLNQQPPRSSTALLGVHPPRLNRNCCCCSLNRNAVGSKGSTLQESK